MDIPIHPEIQTYTTTTHITRTPSTPDTTQHTNTQMHTLFTKLSKKHKHKHTETLEHKKETHIDTNTYIIRIPNKNTPKLKRSTRTNTQTYIPTHSYTHTKL